MDMREHVIALNERKIKINKEQQDFIDDAIKRHPGEPFSAEESQTIARMDADIDAITTEVRSFVEREESAKKDAALREAHASVFGANALEEAEKTQADGIRSWMQSTRNWFAGNERRNEDRDDNGNVTGKNATAFNLAGAQRRHELIRQGIDPNSDEARALLWDTGSIASGVPTLVHDQVYQYMTAGIAALRMPTTKIQSTSGAPIKFPRVNAHGIATQVIAQGTAIGGTDPTFLAVQLDAYKYGQLLQLSNETITDEGFDVLGFVSSNMARAVAEVIDADLIAGTGSGEPQGMMTAAVVGSGGTIGTGGSLITPTYESLIDVVYGVNDRYRNSNSVAWLMKDATAGNLRKIRDGAGGTVGQPIWQMSPWQGLNTRQPDTLLGYPIYTDPNVASLASSNQIAAFGDWSAYYVRMVGDFVLERSDEYAFNTDLVTFRAKQRIDGDYLDLTAVTRLRQAV